MADSRNQLSLAEATFLGTYIDSLRYGRGISFADCYLQIHPGVKRKSAYSLGSTMMNRIIKKIGREGLMDMVGLSKPYLLTRLREIIEYGQEFQTVQTPAGMDYIIRNSVRAEVQGIEIGLRAHGFVGDNRTDQGRMTFADALQAELRQEEEHKENDQGEHHDNGKQP